jgi:hypothetical protein
LKGVPPAEPSKAPMPEHAPPEHAPPEHAAAESDDHTEIRALVHELGNHAHAIRLAAEILKRTQDATQVRAVQKMLEDTAASMGSLGQSLQETSLDALSEAAQADG